MKNLGAILTLFLANTISGIAQGVSMLAIPWYFARKEMMDVFGVFYILANIVAIFWVPYAGTLTDKFDRKHVFLGLTSICAIIVGSVAFLGHSQNGLHWIPVGLIFAITFWNFNLHYPALYAFTQEITEGKYYGKITSFLELQGQTTTMLAGGMAAILLEGTESGMLNLFGFDVSMPFRLEAWTIWEVFTLDAVTYVLAFLIILSIRYVPLTVRHEESGSLLTRLKTGMGFLWHHQAILVFGTASYCIFVTVLLLGFYLDPLYIKEHLKASADVFAGSKIFYAGGALLAGAGVVWFFKRMTIPAAIAILTGMLAIVYFMFFLTGEILVFLAGHLFIGIANAGTRVLRVNWLFRTIPNQIFGRVASVFNILNILMRIAFLVVFSLAFFHREDNVVFAYLIFSAFLIIAATVIIRDYRKFVLQ